MACARNMGADVRLQRVGIAAALLLTATVAGAVDVTFCGQTLPVGATGELVTDLDCSLAYGSYAVVLSKGAKLRLNGFTLSSSANGVHCLGRCKVFGPGTIARTEPSCDETSAIDTYGVFADDKVKLTDVILTSWGYATWASGRLRAAGVTVSGHCLGLAGNVARITVRDSTITDNFGFGVAGAGPVTVSGSDVTGNFIDIVALKRLRVQNSTCATTGGGPGSPPDTWDVCP